MIGFAHLNSIDSSHSNMSQELEVQKRNKCGEPILIKWVEVPPDNDWVEWDNKRIGKKRLKERQRLHQKYQERWSQIYEIPKLLEEAREEREKAEKELETHEPKNDETATCTAVVRYVPPPVAVIQPTQQWGKMLVLNFQVGFCVLFFALALFPGLRSVPAEINGIVLPQMHDTAWRLGQLITDQLPLIKMLYNVFGFWPTVACVGFLLWQVRELFQLLNETRGALLSHVIEVVPCLSKLGEMVQRLHRFKK